MHNQELSAETGTKHGLNVSGLVFDEIHAQPYQQIGIPPEEAQFLETRKFPINEIARLYRIPPHMVGDLVVTTVTSSTNGKDAVFY